MRKTAVYIFIFCVQTALFAEHPAGIGLGLAAGGGPGLAYNSGTAAFSLKIPSLPFYWGLAVNFYDNRARMNVQGDYYFIDKTLDSGLFIGWFCGAGFFLGLELGNSSAGFALGARVPVGLSWQYRKINALDSLEVFAGLTPHIGCTALPVLRFDLVFNFEIGVRIWLKPVTARAAAAEKNE
ncbi:MAG: hypothetical protein LBO67_09275 [Spirochaetaceae bacterium]|jgi:hypothetical protein|nr:hypothetical protein [Spirochaetaceae bacterium]